MPTRGNFDFDQVRAADRQGTGGKFQMATGAAGATGNVLIYDANGNAVDGGVPAGSGTVTHTPGALTANAVILGNGGADVKAGAVLPSDATKFYDGTGTFSTPAGGSTPKVPTFVQMNSARGNTVLSKAFIINCTSGNILIVAIGWFQGAATNPTVSDTLSTSYTRVAGTNGGSGANVAIFVGSAPSSGANTVTITLPSGAGFDGLYIAEFSNLTTTTDGTAATNSLSAFGAQTVTPAQNGDLIVTVLEAQASATTTGVGPWLGVSTTGNDSGGFFFYVQPESGVISAYVTNSSGTTCAQATAALQHA